MKPIVVNLPPFTIGVLNDNADYCINVCRLRSFSNIDENLFEIFRSLKNFIIIINFVNRSIYVKSKLRCDDERLIHR